jgi:phosphomannomutase
MLIKELKEKNKSVIVSLLDEYKIAYPSEISNEIDESLKRDDLWEIANSLGKYYNRYNASAQEVDNCVKIINKIRELQGELARISTEKASVVFGTSGWRGHIGEDFTVLNVHKVARGIIEMLKSDTFITYCGYQSFEDVKRAGILLFHDNRFMGREFCEGAMKELAAEGVKMYYAGECPTGVGSAVLCDLKGAGSINFTPSHNPMSYSGIKFNPADGGPADSDLTSIIEEKSNQLMAEEVNFIPAAADFSELLEDVDAAQIFKKNIETVSKVFDLQKIRAWLNENSTKINILVDNMHGSSRGYIQKLLGEEVMLKLQKDESIKFIHTNDDYSFHGMKPEPSAANQKPLINALQNSDRFFNLAVAMDPDADRIRFADKNMDVDMNRFSAIAYANLLENGIKGGVITSVATSGFTAEVARKNGQEVLDAAVGFKNFKESLLKDEVIIAFEESDGITFTGHTLEKCALAGFLSALDSMANSGKNISTQYEELRQKYGYFYPDRSGVDVKGISVDAWQKYKNDVLYILQNKMYKVGDVIRVGEKEQKIARVITLDGVKWEFEDKSWLLLRPSGTEPKFRYYYEVVSQSPLGNIDVLLEEYSSTANGLLEQARNMVND